MHIAQCIGLWYNGVYKIAKEKTMEKKFDKVAYNNGFNSQHYDRINLIVPKGDRDKIRAYAESKGKSVNAYINDLIQEDMKNHP